MIVQVTIDIQCMSFYASPKPFVSKLTNTTSRCHVVRQMPALVSQPDDGRALVAKVSSTSVGSMTTSVMQALHNDGLEHGCQSSHGPVGQKRRRPLKCHWWLTLDDFGMLVACALGPALALAIFRIIVDFYACGVPTQHMVNARVREVKAATDYVISIISRICILELEFTLVVSACVVATFCIVLPLCLFYTCTHGAMGPAPVVCLAAWLLFLIRTTLMNIYSNVHLFGLDLLAICAIVLGLTRLLNM